MSTINNIDWNPYCNSATGIVAGYLGEEDADEPCLRLKIYHAFLERVVPNLSGTFLHWSQRPREVCLAISRAFEKLSSTNASYWIFNGAPGYNLCGIDDANLLKTIIRQAPSSQKIFYVMDVGAGKFQLGEFLAKAVDEAQDLPSDITVHIISVRGEQNHGEERIQSKRCIRYNFGGFKIEEVEGELLKKEFDLHGKIDLILTRWCMTHLVDPGGTFAQCLALSKGIFVGDAFPYCDEEGASSNVEQINIHMVQLLQNQGHPFLVQRYVNPEKEDKWSTNRFIIKKDSSHSALPMQYVGLWGDYTELKRVGAPIYRLPATGVSSKYSIGSLLGSKELYNWLKDKKLIEPTVEFKRIFREERSTSSGELL